MAKQLNLEEQEQLDELKHFWQTYGNLITWLLIAVFGSIAAWNGYQYWQRTRAVAAAALYDEVERFAAAGDLPLVERATADLREKYGGTAYASQAGLLLAKMAHDKGNAETAKSALLWVADNTGDEGYQAMARLRLSGLLTEGKAYDDALKQLAGTFPAPFSGLVADRKGDIYALQGKRQEAIAEYRKAYAELDARTEYRGLVEVKLASLGVEVLQPDAPAPSAAQAAAPGTVQPAAPSAVAAPAAITKDSK
ncbi:MAG: YfgM family protein [Burkholderiaceae bacterium]